MHTWQKYIADGRPEERSMAAGSFSLFVAGVSTSRRRARCRFLCRHRQTSACSALVFFRWVTVCAGSAARVWVKKRLIEGKIDGPIRWMMAVSTISSPHSFLVTFLLSKKKTLEICVQNLFAECFFLWFFQKGFSVLERGSFGKGWRLYRGLITLVG